MELPLLTLAAGEEVYWTLVALAIIAGIFALRFRRNQQHYDLMRLALEKGVSTLPVEAAPPPAWLRGMRLGVLILTLGASLLVVGAIVFALVPKEPEPPRILAAVAMAIGGVLTPLGLARLLFARVERRYAETSALRAPSAGEAMRPPSA